MHDAMLLMNEENKVGPRTEPWMTPLATDVGGL